LPGPTLEALKCRSLEVFQALGCRDVARVDFRVRDGVPYFLEINPLPGLNPDSSDLVILAGLMGSSHAELVREVFRAALARHDMYAAMVAQPNRVSVG
jgi:D-alanine-D-alanine ligase